MRYLLFAALVPLLWACGRVEDSKEYKELQARYDSVVAVSSGKATENTELNRMIEEIQSNLDSVAKDQLLVGELNKEGYANQKDQIDAKIAAISSYMEKNRNKMAALEKKLSRSGKSNKALKTLVGNLKKQIMDKEAQIAEMQSTIQGLEVRVGELNQTVASKDQEIASKNEEITRKDAELSERQRTIESKETELTTAFYTFGTRKELADMGVIKKEGGVLGMGKTVKISERLDNSKFKKVNLKSLTEIRLGIVKKKKVVSAHPDNSYYFTSSGQEVFMKISDPAKFWSLTKYCVIEID